MLKSMITLSAAFAMSVSSSTAAPLNGSLIVQESSNEASTTKVEGVLGFFLKQASMSLSTALTSMTTVTANEETDEPHYSYAKKSECEAETGDENSEPEQSVKKAPVGPEPIYFGF